MYILLMGIALAFNILIIKFKLEDDRFADAGTDGGILLVLGYVFGGSIEGLAIATVGSAFISVFLMISPPDYSWIDRM